jgi:opacity protein-like surface antigen
VSKKFQSILQVGVVVFCLLPGIQPYAADLTFLIGYQGNSDFELSDSIDTLRPNQSIGESGDNLNLDGGLATSIAIDFLFNEQLNHRFGFYLSHHETGFEANAGLQDVDIDVIHLHFTAMNYYPRGRWEPFVAAGVGGGNFSPADKSLKDETVFSAQVAGGVNYKLTEAFLLRFEARWIGSFFNGGSAIFCSGGCTIAVKSNVYNQFQANIGFQYRF